MSPFTRLWVINLTLRAVNGLLISRNYGLNISHSPWWSERLLSFLDELSPPGPR